MIFAGSRRRVSVHERFNSVSGRLADTPCVAAALSNPEGDLWISTSRLDKAIEKIIGGSGCTHYKLFVSGGENFRYEIDPLYKANRPKEPIKWREECKQHLIDRWGAIETDGYEADDAVGCEQRYDGSTIICGIDKDLLMIAGKHYQWPIMRKGEVVREAKFLEITPEEGIRTFFEQMLTGDANDNIGTWFDKSTGTWKKKKFLLSSRKAEELLSFHSSPNEEEMYDLVKFHYASSLMVEDSEAGIKEFYKNLDLLWIWRNYGETYSIRSECTTLIN